MSDFGEESMQSAPKVAGKVGKKLISAVLSGGSSIAVDLAAEAKDMSKAAKTLSSVSSEKTISHQEFSR